MKSVLKSSIKTVTLVLFTLSSVAYAKPVTIDGVNYPEGRVPQEIKDNKYPRSYFPNTEKLGKKEMRIIALGTGMPNQTPNNKAASFMVELGNGEIFLFDLGTGSTDNLSGLQADYANLDKVFATHLHTDHIGDLATLWIGGWVAGRYTPMHVYGPSGTTPALGTASMVEGITKAWAWDVAGRSGVLPDAGGKIIAHEFDYKKTAVVYNENGVKVTSFPAIHVIDGAVSYRLEWEGLSFVFGGDSYPNKWYLKEAKGVDVAVHECFFTPEQWMKIAGFPYKNAYFVTSMIHTPPEAFGKVMDSIKPRMAVAYHYWNHRDIEFEIHAGVRKTYDGPLTMANDLTVINVTKEHIEVREASINHEAWGQGTSKAWDEAPRSKFGDDSLTKFLLDGKITDFVEPPKKQ